MAMVTLRVLEGADRGQVYEDLPTPITIGREEGNVIQLNDERISRFHVKIQEDQDKLVLTDLESTNGTKVNGEEMQLRILRYGDVIHVGRSLLLYGTREQIAQRLASLRAPGDSNAHTLDPDQVPASLDFELHWNENSDLQTALHFLEPPELPERLSPGQAAQLSELLEFFHIRLRDLIESVTMEDEAEKIELAVRQWQNLLDLQARLAEYLRTISDPENGQD